MAYVRGPEGIIVSLAERIGWARQPDRARRHDGLEAGQSAGIASHEGVFGEALRRLDMYGPDTKVPFKAAIRAPLNVHLTAA
jgi:uncharacterized lipoprotein NlpE involved in copper resistance